MIVRHTEVIGHLPSAIALYRAALAQMRNDIPETIAQARRGPRRGPAGPAARARVPPPGCWRSPCGRTASSTPPTRPGRMPRPTSIAPDTTPTCSAGTWRWATSSPPRADSATLDARMNEGCGSGPRARRRCAGRPTCTWDWPSSIASGTISRPLPNQLDAAAALGDALGLPQNPYRRRLAMRGPPGGRGRPRRRPRAPSTRQSARTCRDFFPEVRPVGAVRARLWTRQGRHQDALAWAAERRVSVGDDRDVPPGVRARHARGGAHRPGRGQRQPRRRRGHRAVRRPIAGIPLRPEDEGGASSSSWSSALLPASSRAIAARPPRRSIAPSHLPSPRASSGSSWIDGPGDGRAPRGTRRSGYRGRRTRNASSAASGGRPRCRRRRGSRSSSP